MNRDDEQDWNLPPEGQSWADTDDMSDWQAPNQPDQLPQHQPPGQNQPKPSLQSDDYLPVALALIPGLGQLMLGQTTKGLVILGLAIFTCAGGGLISIASVIDAYLVAIARQRREVGEWEFFPDFQDTFNV